MKALKLILDYERAQAKARRTIFTVSTVLVIALIAGLTYDYVRSHTNRPHEDSTLVQCALNLRVIGRGLLQYAQDHQNHFPDRIELVLDNITVGPECFVCPKSTLFYARGATTKAIQNDLISGNHVSYIYCAAGLSMPLSDEAILAYEPIADHERGSNVLFGDGHVEFVNKGAMKFCIAELARGHNPPSSPTNDERAVIERDNR